MRQIIALAILLLAALGPAPAAAQTPEERTRLDWALQRGRLLFEIDRAAWVTTDDMREAIPDPAAAGIRGWTVERDGEAYVVTFYAGEGDARAAAYRGRVENRRVVSREVFATGAGRRCRRSSGASPTRASRFRAWPFAPASIRPSMPR